jgi:hypothetical protein
MMPTPDYELTLRYLERQDAIDRRVHRIKMALDVAMVLLGIVALVGVNL